MVYRVIIKSGSRELWFDFNEFSQACVFAEAAKLKNVPIKPAQYGKNYDDTLKLNKEQISVKVLILSVEEHETEIKTFQEELKEIRRQLKEEEMAKYAE